MNHVTSDGRRPDGLFANVLTTATTTVPIAATAEATDANAMEDHAVDEDAPRLVDDMSDEELAALLHQRKQAKSAARAASKNLSDGARIWREGAGFRLHPSDFEDMGTLSGDDADLPRTMI